MSNFVCIPRLTFKNTMLIKREEFNYEILHSQMGLCTPSPPNINRLNLINLGNFKSYDPLPTSMSHSKESSSVLMQLFMTTSGYTTIFNRKERKTSVWGPGTPLKTGSTTDILPSKFVRIVNVLLKYKYMESTWKWADF